MSRRFRISKKDFDNIGFTPQCPGCSAIIRGKPAVNHSEDCRIRVDIELERLGDARVSNSAVRMEEYKAEKRLREEEDQEKR